MRKDSVSLPSKGRDKLGKSKALRKIEHMCREVLRMQKGLDQRQGLVVISSCIGCIRMTGRSSFRDYLIRKESESC